MPERKLLSVGFSIPGDEYELVDPDSDRSLLDADVILFVPQIDRGHYDEYGATYQGLPKLSEEGSFRALEVSKHWRLELQTALDDGKTVFVFLAQPERVWRYTGNKEFSGTGRNRQTTNLLAPFTSYESLPFAFKQVIPRRGTGIAPASNLSPIEKYWHEFRSISPFEVYVEGEFAKVLLTTRTGGKVVGGLVRKGTGTIVLLPPVQYDEDEFTRRNKKGEEFWNEKAVSFGSRFAGALLEIDRSLRQAGDPTPPPQWAEDVDYRSSREKELRIALEVLDRDINVLVERRAEAVAALQDAAVLKRLLYATGKELETAILEALRILGFSASNLKEGESEFDAVFQSDEGRFLGEAEGKETKAINIDKLSQLERNISEDFASDDVSEPAKGVLFGNAYRLSPLKSRQPFFTQKCLSGAKRTGIALVRTPDLFSVATYVQETGDIEYARTAREAIRNTAGEVVSFPDRPNQFKDS